MRKDYILSAIIFVAGIAYTAFTNHSIVVAISICIVTILCSLVTIFYRQILNFLRCFLPLCGLNAFKEFTTKKSVFGRDHLVRNIFVWHNNNRSNKIAIISGAAGTGKTTLANAIKASSFFPSNVVVITKGDLFYKSNTNLKGYKNNCIIIFDYVLESFKKIRVYIDDLTGNNGEKKPKKQKISVILLERDIAVSSIMQFVGVEETNILQINLDDYKLDNHTLTEIVKYKVQYEEDKKAIKREITEDDARMITRMITEQLDRDLCRPIFASVLATIYRRSETFNCASIATRDEAFSFYWDVVTEFHKFLPHDLENDEGTLNYIQSLKYNVKIVSIFVTITTMDILCYMEGNNIIIQYRDSNNGKEIEVNSLIQELVRDAFLASRATPKNLTMWLRHLYQHNSTVNENPIGIIIHPMTLDLFSSWMLSQAMKEDRNLLSKWFTTISQIDDGKYYNRAYNFIIRAAEDFGNNIFEWFSDINLPENVLVYQLENAIITDINYILDRKTESSLQLKYQLFEKHYNQLETELSDYEKLKRITLNIVDIIDNQEEREHSADGFKQLQSWCEQHKQNLDKGGLSLKNDQ